MSLPRDVWSGLAAWTRNEDPPVLFWPFLLGYSTRIARAESAAIFADPLLYSRVLHKGTGLLDADVISAWDDASPLLGVIERKYTGCGGVPLERGNWADVEPGWLKTESALKTLAEGLRIVGSFVGKQRLLFVPIPGPLAIATLLGGDEFAKAVAAGEEDAFDLLSGAVFLANELVRQTMETGVRGLLVLDKAPPEASAACRERVAEEYQTIRNTVDYFKGILMRRGEAGLRPDDFPAGIYHGVLPGSAEAVGQPCGASSRVAAILSGEVWKGDPRGISEAFLRKLLEPQRDAGSGRLVVSDIPADADPERVLKVQKLVREVLQ